MDACLYLSAFTKCKELPNSPVAVFFLLKPVMDAAWHKLKLKTSEEEASRYWNIVLSEQISK